MGKSQAKTFPYGLNESEVNTARQRFEILLTEHSRFISCY